MVPQKASKMIEVTSHPEGVILAVRVQPRARRAGVVGEHNGALKVAVTAPPEKGKANEAAVRLLGAELALSRSQVRLISGETSRDKRFLLVGVRPADLATRLNQLAQGAS
jgi:hypothetical protein